MKINIRHKRFLELSQETQNKLYDNFTLKKESYMRRTIDFVAGDIDTFIVRNGNKILGWGCIRHEYSKLLLMIFIDPKYRRMGLATQILRSVKKVKKYRDINMCPWDDISYSVVNNFKKKFKLGVIV